MWLRSASMILAADVVWRLELVEAFVTTFAKIMSMNAHAVGLILYTFREDDVDALFHSCLEKSGLSIETVVEEECHPNFGDESMVVYVCRNRE